MIPSNNLDIFILLEKLIKSSNKLLVIYSSFLKFLNSSLMKSISFCKLLLLFPITFIISFICSISKKGIFDSFCVIIFVIVFL